MDTKGLILQLFLLLTIFTLPGHSTFLRDIKLGKKESIIAEKASDSVADKVTDIFEKFVKPTTTDLGESLLAKAKDTVESVFQHKDEFLAKAKDKVGSSLKTLEDEGTNLLSKAKEKVGNSLQQNEEILAKAKGKVGSSLKTIEQESSDLLAKAKGRVETKLHEKDELVAKAKGKIGHLLEKKDADVLAKPLDRENSLLQQAKDSIATSFRAMEDERNSLLAKAKEKVENSLLGKTFKEHAEGAKKFNLLGAKPFNSLFLADGSNIPKISGLKIFSPKEDATLVEVDDFQYPPSDAAPQEAAKDPLKTPETCYARPIPKDEEPLIAVLPENKPLDFEKIDEGYYQDSREFEDGLNVPNSPVEYEEVEPSEYLPEELSNYSNEDFYSVEHSEGLKGQKRHISYDRLFRKPKTKAKTASTEIHERFSRGIGNVKKLINLAGQVDSFFSGKVRNTLKTLSQIYESEDDYKNGNR